MTQPSRRPFGTTPGGQPVELLILDNGTLRCELLTLGATLRTLEVPVGMEAGWTWCWL